MDPIDTFTSEELDPSNLNITSLHLHISGLVPDTMLVEVELVLVTFLTFSLSSMANIPSGEEGGKHQSLQIESGQWPESETRSFKSDYLLPWSFPGYFIF